MKVFIGEVLDKKSVIAPLVSVLGIEQKNNALFQDVDYESFKDIFELTKNLEESDYILLPHNYFAIKGNREFIGEYEKISEKYNKKIIVFASGDSDEKIRVENSVVFRTSQYKSKLKTSEVIMPIYIEDLSKKYGFAPRQKSDLPVVGFCGWASFDKFWSRVKFCIKNTFTFGAHKQGVYFRSVAINLLKKSSLVKNNFIIRKSFSGHRKTIEILPEKAREEYINNILESDFVLAPKGDGNYSLRFYETLALGRIPILIDTDTPLPLEKELDYSKFVLRVSYKDINKLPQIISEFYKNITNDEFINMQKLAREVFQKFLRQDMFLRFVSIRGLERLLK